MFKDCERVREKAMIGRIIVLFVTGVMLHVGAIAQPRPFSFIAIGDAGMPGPILDGVSAAARVYDARAERAGEQVSTMLFLGDNFYPTGLNQPRDVMRWLVAAALDPFRPLMHRLGRDNVQSIAGNHEYYCQSVGPVPLGTCFNGNIRANAIRDWTYHYEYPASIRRALFEGARDSVEFILFDSGYLLATPMTVWQPVLDSLDRLIAQSALRADVKWRIFVAHHSPYSAGEHGGYRLWSSRLQRVLYIGNCIDEGMDPFRYPYQLMSNSDNCHPEYRAYSNYILEAMDRSPAKFQLMLAGHDHNLQLLRRVASAHRPSVFVISGAGSKTTTVRSPSPPNIYTHPINTPEARGASRTGFVAGVFRRDRLELEFIGEGEGDVMDMGGASRFAIDVNGELIVEK